MGAAIGLSSFSIAGGVTPGLVSGKAAIIFGGAVLLAASGTGIDGTATSFFGGDSFFGSWGAGGSITLDSDGGDVPVDSGPGTAEATTVAPGTDDIAATSLFGAAGTVGVFEADTGGFGALSGGDVALFTATRDVGDGVAMLSEGGDAVVDVFCATALFSDDA